MLTDTSTPSQRGTESNDIDKLLNTLQISRTGASLSDAVWCHTQDLPFFRELGRLYSSVEDTISVF